MEVTCNNCKAKLNIPDEKIPADQMVRVNCPKCKYKITIDSKKENSENRQSIDPYAETGKIPIASSVSPPSSTPEDEIPRFDEDLEEDEDEALVFFEEDVRLALIMVSDEDHAVKIKSVLEELGYKCIDAPTTRDALGKMRFHHFDLIYLVDGFDGQGLTNSPILNYLNHINISSRRRIFLALMSDKFKSLDEMVAFSMSANAVINPKDLEKLHGILRKAISDNEKFYKVFMDTLVGVGKT